MRAFSTKTFLSMSFANGVVQLLSFYFLLLALVDSNLSIVYSINAHYILIPVLLSVWLYKEHWNTQKAAALVLSMLALVLLHR
jgi:multidrug transporter EmrE-like cation transporter